MVREGRVFISPTGKPEYGIGYYVTAYEVGAQVAAASSGTTATVRAGHGFAASDKLIVGTDATLYRRVTAVTTTTLTLDSAISLADGDLLVNLGQDTGATAPNYDGNGLAVYADMDYSNQLVNNTVLVDSFGKYRYFHKGNDIWELVRTGNTPIAVNAGINSKSEFINLGKPSTLSESTEIRFYRDQDIVWRLGEDYWPNIPRSYFALWSDKGITGSVSGDIFGVSWFGAETESIHGGVGGVDSPKWFFNSSPYSNFAAPYTFNFYGGNNSGIAKQALFQHYSNTGNNGGIDVHVAGTNDGLEVRNEDGSQYRASIRFCRTTTAGGSTINADWLCGMGISANGNIWSVYDQAANSTRLMFNSSGSSLFSNATGTYLPTYPFDHLHEAATTNAATVPFALRYRLSAGTAAIGLGLYQSFRMPDAGGTEAQGGAVGAVITDATAGALKAQMQLWSSYAVAPVISVTHARKVLINTTTETNATAITVALDADSHAAITLQESTANPATPTSGAEMRVYMKADKFIIQYNDAGTVRWKYLDLTGTGVTWTHTAAAP